MDEQRQYLGGDGDHSILVRGLDISLLEQNKAKAGLSTEDDDSLEKAFQEASSIVPKKRTRADLITELKEKRGQSTAESNGTKITSTAAEEARLLEEAKKKGKFKPIGFKPIGKPDDGEGKKKKVKGDGERKKKKRKVQADGDGESTRDVQMASPSLQMSMSEAPLLPPAAEPEPEIDDSFDIFTGAGEYEGIDMGEDDGDDDEPSRPNQDPLEKEEGSSLPHRWVSTGESDQSSKANEILKSAASAPRVQEIEEGEEEEEATRLIPLASSALPSIKEYLAMEKAANSYGGKKKRKDKKKGAGEEGAGDGQDKKKLSTEAKVERDYKKFVFLPKTVERVWN